MIKIKAAPLPQRKALILVPTISGTIFPYLEIAKHLGPAIDCWGLRNRPSMGSVEDAAKLYLEPLLKLNAEGYSLQLMGWSYGGVLAYEICSQLERTGVHPDGTFILDCPLPAAEDASVPQYIMQNKYYEMIVEDVPNIYYKDKLEIMGAIRRKGYTYSDETLDALFESYVTNFSRWRSFVPKDTRSPIYLIQATIQVFPRKKMDSWTLITNDLRNERLEGNHFDIVKGSNAIKIAKLISR